jgi:PAS domain-containing protein
MGQSGPLRIAAGTRFAAAAAAGADRALYEAVSAGDAQPQLIALRRVEGWPAYAAASRPRAAIIAGWRKDVARQLAVGMPATLALLGLALLLRRGQRRLAAANAGLEARVAARTAELAESEAEFRAAFESTIVGMVQVDPLTGRFLRVNRRYCEIVGRSEAELLGGMTVRDVTHPEDGAADAAGFGAILAGADRYEL